MFTATPPAPLSFFVIKRIVSGVNVTLESYFIYCQTKLPTHSGLLDFKRLESNNLSQQIHVNYELTFLFKVSKTTIWRRLQQSGGNKQIKFLESNTDLAESDLNFQEVFGSVFILYKVYFKLLSYLALSRKDCI